MVRYEAMAQTREWYNQDIQKVFEGLGSAPDGLTAHEAAARLHRDGPNTLPEAKPDSIALVFFRQFQSPLIYVLFAAAMAVLLLGEQTDALVIFAVLLFNATVGTIQEGRAQHTLRALKQYVETSATVLRGGDEVIVPDREVVRGDTLVVREGEKIPADARVVNARGLLLDESSLTGESTPVSKGVDPIYADNLPIAEQHNMVFKGTHVVAGEGRILATATGTHTLIGSIAEKMSLFEAEIPLRADIRRLSRSIIVVVAIVSVVLLVLGLARGEALYTVFATVVSLAVSIIPEGLPIVITLVLATGVWRMSKKNALVKKMQAVEALGQAQVLAVDKTGTITRNELVVREVWAGRNRFQIEGSGYEPKGTISYGGAVVDLAEFPELTLAAKIAVFCANARVSYAEEEKKWRVAGDPTEAALHVFAEKSGFKKEDVAREHPMIDEIPFDYRRKYHAVSQRVDGRQLLALEGAPEEVLALCSHIRINGVSRPLTKSVREEIETELVRMSELGLRVVAGAMRAYTGALAPEKVRNLTLVSLIGMQDTLRPGVANAVARAIEAGMRVIMITGDYERTARAIAREAGIWHEGDQVLTGAAMDGMSDAELSARLEDISVIARVTPEHKLRIIEAYRHRGEIIAMTGDGVNDAPSLVAADLGIAMGTIGTEVAKEASDIVLLDDNFGSIVSAVEEGRSIYKTTQKVLLYLFSTSMGEGAVILGALLLDYPLPLLPAQIIWLNLVTDGFLDVALAMEPKEDGLLHERKHGPLVGWRMLWRMVFMALPMALGTLFVFTGYVGDDMTKAWTMSLTVLAVFQWLNAWNSRSSSRSVFEKMVSNPYLLGATGVVVTLQILAVYTPFLQKTLHTTALSLYEWLLVVVVAASVVLCEEARKVFVRSPLWKKKISGMLYS